MNLLLCFFVRKRTIHQDLSETFRNESYHPKNDLHRVTHFVIINDMGSSALI